MARSTLYWALRYLWLPAPLQSAYQFMVRLRYEEGNTLLAGRYEDLLNAQWERWNGRRTDPVIIAAQKLQDNGWWMECECKLVLRSSRLAMDNVLLANFVENVPSKGISKQVFSWHSENGRGYVPLRCIYNCLELPHGTEGEEQVAWETCYWLSFLTSVQDRRISREQPNYLKRRR